jgi:hypothetical protein
MVLMLIWWMMSVLSALVNKKETSSEAIWACALIGLLLFNALWTRPFHRIENILWLSLAFAIANREMLLNIPKFSISGGGKNLSILIGTVFMVISAAGILFLSDGMYGDRQLRLALSTNNAQTQRALLEKAQNHMMVKLEAEKQLAYHYISYGDAMRSQKDVIEGLDRLMAYFKKEPHSQELSILLDWAQRTQNVEVLKYLVDIFKPGTYVLREAPVATPDMGQMVPAVIEEASPNTDNF